MFNRERREDSRAFKSKNKNETFLNNVQLLCSRYEEKSFKHFVKKVGKTYLILAYKSQ